MHHNGVMVCHMIITFTVSYDDVIGDLKIEKLSIFRIEIFRFPPTLPWGYRVAPRVLGLTNVPRYIRSVGLGLPSQYLLL